LAPAAAQAASSSAFVYYGALNYNAAAGAANHVVVTSSGSTVHLSDTGSGVSIAPSYGCTGGGSAVTCTGVWTIRLNVGDGDNFVDSRGAALGASVFSGAGSDTVYTGGHNDYLSSGAGNDRLDPGAGADTVYAGAGADIVSARDGSVDKLNCGTEVDSGKADPSDTINTDCEALATTDPPPGGTAPSGGTDPGTSPGTKPGGGSGTGGDGTTPAGNPLANLMRPVLPRQTAAVSPKGVARVRVACPAGAGRCKGRVDLLLPKRHAHARAAGEVSAARRRPARRRIGHAKLSVGAGHSLRVPVRLNRRGRRRVLRGRHRKTRVQLVVTTRTASGRVVKTRRGISLRRVARRRGRR
jgi:hypothetical protein